MTVERRTQAVERVSVALMSCGLMLQVLGLCWLPFNLHPEDGLSIADFQAFGLVLAGAGMVGLGLMVRLWQRAPQAGTETEV